MNSPYIINEAKPQRPQRLLDLAPQKVVDRKTGEDFNPPAFGGFNRSGSMRTSDGKVFNEQGVLNAGTSQEALMQIQYVLDRAKTEAVNITNTPTGYDDASCRQILAQALHDPTNEGFSIMGQELLGPVRLVIDYEGMARKILGPRDVKQGEIVRYDLDVIVTGWQIGNDGQTPECYQGGQYMYPAFTEFTAKPSVKIKDIYEMQYDVLARIQDRARQAIEFQEDRALRALLFSASTASNTAVSWAALDLAAIEAMRYEVERHRLVADKLLINRQELSDIITQVSTQVDPITQRELVMAGFVGSILNLMIITSAGTNTFEVIPPGEAYVVTNSSYLGAMPVRVPLMSQPADLFINGLPVRGWFWYEELAELVFNPKAVARGLRL